ncbi:hypothetical protein RB623_16920 [Mesorhizobium sp. LHD-90]|uniref:hypothetical protein n=1 Tax=Mesorhizobium sp. LHD-90 TaxID=3071414 RepID=UPI0027DECDCE|nr:hypothetical protein [Mesorhizobium sp. LHD-90]MDQ6435740.1 hypothetical protein [Mesorhizobium sp. LHD-90]
MSKATEPSAPGAKAGLLLNRLLFERRGDEFVDAFAALVRDEGLIVNDEPLLNLLETARSVRSSAGISFSNERSPRHPPDER